MMYTHETLSDVQWQQIEPLLPKPLKRGRGKPHTPWKAVVNSILFILATGAKWEALPKGEEFASKSAAHRWFICWQKSGLLDQILATLHTEKKATLIFPPRRQTAPRYTDLAIAPAIAAI